jgi:hypothetical protein
MSLDETTLRNELRGFDGDLYLTHLFAPSVSRPKLMRFITPMPIWRAFRTWLASK